MRYGATELMDTESAATVVQPGESIITELDKFMKKTENSVLVGLNMRLVSGGL